MVTGVQRNGNWLPGAVSRERPPSIDEVLTILSEYQSYYRQFHNNCETARDYYFGRNSIPVPQGFEPIKTATAKALINIATDHVDVNNISIDVPLASPRAKPRAERLKKFYQGCWMNVKPPVLRTAARHAFAYGLGWLKVMFASELWPGAPSMADFPSEDEFKEALATFMEERNLRFPFVVRNVSPTSIVWDDSRTGISWAMEFYDRKAGDIRKRYPQWASSTKDSDLASWAEYWDDTWVGYIADREWVWGPEQHGYGFLPYVPIIPAASLDFDDGKPEERYQGLTTGVQSLLNEEARAMTAYSAILRKFAWTTLNFSGPPGAAEKTRDEYEVFGGANVLPPGVSVAEGPAPMPPPELLQFLGVLENQIEMATFPNIIRGLRPRGVSTGFGLSVLAGMGRLVFQGVADGLARAIEQCNSRFAMLVENKVQGRVTVHARSDIHSFDQTIGPDDVRGYYENVVHLKAEAPEERERESLLAFRLWNAGNGIMSQYEAMRRAGVANPLEEMMQMEAEFLMKSPEIRAEKIRLAAEGIGLLQQLAEAVGVPQGEPGSIGNRFLPGMGQGPRVGERQIQQARVASRAGQESVFPRGLSGIDLLGRRLSMPTGTAVPMPSGQEVG